MGKFVGVIVFIGAVAFLAYMLITGQASVAWERVIIYAVIVGGISLAGRARENKQKKQDQEYFKKHPENNPLGDNYPPEKFPQERRQEDALWKNVASTDAEGSGGEMPGSRPSVSGVVRISAGIRGVIYFFLVFIWLLTLVCTALAAADGAFSDGDMGTIGSFGGLFAVAVGSTLLFAGILNYWCCEIYYTGGGVTVKKGRKEQHYRWSEIGSYTRRGYQYIFRDREGKRLFLSNSSYEGFDGFFEQYRKTHGTY